MRVFLYLVFLVVHGNKAVFGLTFVLLESCVWVLTCLHAADYGIF